jgi:hypothetical protein
MNYRSKFIVEPGEQASIFENQTFAMIWFRWTEKPIKEFLKTTIIGGTSFLLPVALVVLVLSYALRLVKRIATPISHSLQLDQLGDLAGVGAATLLSVLALILVSFAAGIRPHGCRRARYSMVGDLIFWPPPALPANKKHGRGPCTYRECERFKAGFGQHRGWLADRISAGKAGKRLGRGVFATGSHANVRRHHASSD